MEKEKELKTYDYVYYVEENSELHLNPVAIQPKIKDNKILWEDTARGTAFTFQDFKIVGDEQKPSEIEFKSEQGDVIKLKFLDLDTYNKHVKDRVACSPSFPSTEALQEYYLNTNFYAY